ncbi:hypothetical protein [Burkholderia guangdongensis]|uniref:hypothetical protein n=1 Tax=Burkholderia guangdongensis TaxID=1792500 RepID=UPI0015CCFE4B|nr:hypothetical protein [Burkholderia guangdongensis]
MNTKSKKEVNTRHSFAKSLVLVAFFAALALSTSIITSLVLIDFVHGNPNRPQSNAALMMILFPPIFGLVAIIGTFIVFSPSQIILALMMRVLHPRAGRYAYIFIGLMVPFISIATWYCYDYLTPTNFNLAINEGADWVPYQHGINIKRYLVALVCQGLVTTFSIFYFDSEIFRRSKKPIFLGIVFAAITIGAIWGYRIAITQYQFIDHPSP